MTTNEPVVFKSSLHSTGRAYHQHVEHNPCAGCGAWCCRMLFFRHHAPTTFMDLDYIRYMVNFKAVTLLITRAEEWNVIVEDACRHLEPSTYLCTVHDTTRQPRTCTQYNQWACTYKPTFADPAAADSIHVDADEWETVLANVRLDDSGELVDPVTWSFLRALLRSPETPWADGETSP